MINEIDNSTKNSSKGPVSSSGFSKTVLRDKNNFIQFCSPNCLHKHDHNYLYDYSKNLYDPLNQRPGIDFYLTPKITVEQAKQPLDPNMGEFGYDQTPIDLSTKMPVAHSFKDKAFEFNYDPLSQKEQMKFNETGDQYFYDIKKNKDEPENNNFLRTQTISLFDNHISEAKLYGL
jgi:hypothetical protein